MPFGVTCSYCSKSLSAEGYASHEAAQAAAGALGWGYRAGLFFCPTCRSTGLCGNTEADRQRQSFRAADPDLRTAAELNATGTGDNGPWWLKEIAVQLAAMRQALEDRPRFGGRRVVLRARRRFRRDPRYMMQCDIEAIARRVVETLQPNPHVAHDLARRIVSIVRSPGNDDEKVVEVALLLRGEKS